MNIERVRSILGVWAPMAIGLFIIVTSINFYFTAPLVGTLESWRLVCSTGAFFVGGVLMLSTYGRYRKTKEARREGTRPATSLLPPTARQDEGARNKGNRDDRDD
jgi:hypothetical protein